MNIANLLKIALKALNNNKLRCFLTMLGIIIGVASVITMLAIGQGSKNSIKEQISEMGSCIGYNSMYQFYYHRYGQWNHFLKISRIYVVNRCAIITNSI